MKTMTFGVAGALMLLLAIAVPTRAAEPVLLKATVTTHTNDDDKDHDTCVFVDVKSADGDSIIAHAENHECSSDDSKQYKDGSDHTFDLSVDGVGMEKSAARGFTVHMWQETHNGRGHDTWKFNATVTLFFSDRTTLVAPVTNVTFNSNGTGDRPAVDFRNGR
jgi:hypothetical protein